jgi:hypothetical protein
MWCCTAWPAQALSYPPKIGCFVATSTSPDAGTLLVRGIGFGAQQRVLVEVEGRARTRALADRSGAFQALLTIGGSRTTGLLTATDATCRVSTQLSGGNGPHFPGTEEPVPAGAPAAAAIPYVPLTGLAPQLFLGVAGGLLLAGTGLTGLTGRIGRR